MRSRFIKSAQSNLIFVGILVLLFMLVGLFLFNFNQTNSQVKFSESSKENVKLLNKTNSIKIQASKIEGKDFILTLKNESEKVITSIYLVAAKDETHHIEFLHSDFREGLYPNSSYDFPIQLSDALYSYGVVIHSVLFDDNTSEGTPQFITEMKNTRLGEKAVFSETIRELRKISESEDARYYSRLQELKESIKSFPNNSKETQSSAYNSGIHFAKQMVSNLIDEASSIHQNVNQTKILELETKLKTLTLKIQD